jgi:hypothetical protein
MICACVVQEIVDKRLDEGWTPTHGHFLIMGGFSLVRADHETVLDHESFFELVGIPSRYRRFTEPFEIAFPTITAAEINDKARGDFLSKAIAILQTIWFIAQCIARGKQGLALTELELVTVALASLNGVMYYFWWDKPLGVNEPIKVYPSNVDRPKKVLKGAGRLVSIIIEILCAGYLRLHTAAFSLFAGFFAAQPCSKILSESPSTNAFLCFSIPRAYSFDALFVQCSIQFYPTTHHIVINNQGISR